MKFEPIVSLLFFDPRFFLLNMQVTILKFGKAVDNIHLEGTVSQHFNIGPSSVFVT